MEYTIILINIVCSILILSGIVMTIIGLPGNILIVLTGLVYGYYDNFQHVNYTVIAFLVGVFLLGELIEFWAGMVGAKKEKASKRAMLATFAGTVLGTIWGTAILPLIGSIIGALLGGFVITALAEYSKTKNKEQAKRVAVGVLKGQIAGIIFKTTIAVCMAITLLLQLNW